MKIGFVLSPGCLLSNVYSGIVVQARCWSEALSAVGHDVEFPNPLRPIDWDVFDIVHLFQHGPWCESLIEGIDPKRAKIVLSPIIDPPRPYGPLHTLASLIPFERLKLAQNQRLLRKYSALCDLILARSILEKQSLLAVGASEASIVIAPISMSHDWTIGDAEVATHPRNDAVLHISHLSQRRKNVKRLVGAAIERGFPLRLAGSIADPAFRSWLDQVVTAYPNIVYLGRISDDAMREEMLSCSAFCLPSLFEGVGLVALDAAYCGAQMVVTSAGGTRDYLGAHAEYVEPTDQRAIGNALVSALDAGRPNLDVRRHVIAEHTKSASGTRLEAAYRRILESAR